MKNKVLYSVIVVCLMCNFGCSSAKDARTVSEENLFLSTVDPKLQLKIDPGLSYLGQFEKTEIVKEFHSNVDRESYLFGQIKDNGYRKGVLIRISTLPQDLVWRGQVFRIDDPNETLDTGVMETEAGKYRYIVLAPGGVFNEDEAEFITGKGYLIPHCYMVKILGKQIRRARIYIYYFENLSSCNAWDPDALTNEQQKFFDGFIERSADTLVFQ